MHIIVEVVKSKMEKDLKAVREKNAHCLQKSNIDLQLPSQQKWRNKEDNKVLSANYQKK